MTAGAAAVIWRGCRRGWGAGGERGRRPISACRERPSPRNLDVAKGAHDLDLEVREGGDDLPFAAAAGEARTRSTRMSSKAFTTSILMSGKALTIWTLPRSWMPCRCNWPCRGRGPAPGRARRAGRGRGGSAFFSWGRDGSARPSALQAQPARQLVQVAGVHLQHAGGRGPVASCACSASRTCWRWQASTASRGRQHAVRRRGGRRVRRRREGTQVGAGQVQQAGLQRDDVVAVGARLTALMAARLMTCSSSRTLPGQR